MKYVLSDYIEESAIFVKPQQWPTPSESIAIYCVRKLVSCITHLQSCAKVNIWNKKKKLRTVAKIKTQGYKNWRLPKFSTNVTPPLNTATTLFNEPRSQQHCSTNPDRRGVSVEFIPIRFDDCEVFHVLLGLLPSIILPRWKAGMKIKWKLKLLWWHQKREVGAEGFWYDQLHSPD